MRVFVDRPINLHRLLVFFVANKFRLIITLNDRLIDMKLLKPHSPPLKDPSPTCNSCPHVFPSLVDLFQLVQSDSPLSEVGECDLWKFGIDVAEQTSLVLLLGQTGTVEKLGKRYSSIFIGQTRHEKYHDAWNKSSNVQENYEIDKFKNLIFDISVKPKYFVF